VGIFSEQVWGLSHERHHRAREDVRGDVVRARHRVSKLLLRQGIVYYEVQGHEHITAKRAPRDHLTNAAERRGTPVDCSLAHDLMPNPELA